MKVKINKEDIVRHWGIWMVKQNKWFANRDGIIYSVTCPRVANAQQEFMLTDYYPPENDVYTDENLEVREIK